MATIDIKVKDDQIARVEAALTGIPRGVGRVMSHAINRTLMKARTVVIRRMGQHITAAQKTIRANMTVLKANYNSWRADIKLSEKRIPLLAFATRQTQKGVSFKIERRKSIKREMILHAFITAMKTGHRGVWRRAKQGTTTIRNSQGKRATYKWIAGSFTEGKLVGRLPIREMMGPSLGAIYRKNHMLSRVIEAQIGKDLETEVDKSVKYVLWRHRGKTDAAA
jgi:hypothetical protein